LIETERYLLACMVYIDLNPERAHLVQNLADWPWSSCAFHLGQRSDALLTPHALYWALGNTPFAREAAYRQMLQTGLDSQQTSALTDATLRGWALGSAEFVADLHSKSARRAVKVRAGRPRIHKEN
jgi:putative transposase